MNKKELLEALKEMERAGKEFCNNRKAQCKGCKFFVVGAYLDADEDVQESIPCPYTMAEYARDMLLKSEEGKEG